MKIIGYFSNMKDANNTIDQLNKNGFTRAFVDLYAVDSSKGPLVANSPMASGMGKFEEVADANYSVIVEAETNEEEKIRKIIKDMGGNFQNPNVDIPKGLDKINFL